MSEPSTLSAGSYILIVRRWDAQRLETKSLIPAGSSAAVLLWSEPTNVEAGPSVRLANLLASGLVALGEIKFRVRGPVVPELREVGLIATWIVSGRHAWKVVGTRDPDAAEWLFADGWACGDQIGVIAASDERARHLVSLTNVAGEQLRENEVLIAAIVDGAGMVVATPSAAQLESVLGNLAETLTRGGAPVRELLDGADLQSW